MAAVTENENSVTLTPEQCEILDYLNFIKEGLEAYLETHSLTISAIKQLDPNSVSAYSTILAFNQYWMNDPCVRRPIDLYGKLNRSIVKITGFLENFPDLDPNIKRRIKRELETCDKVLENELGFVDNIRHIITEALEEKTEG